MRRNARNRLKGRRDPDDFPILERKTPLQELVRGGPHKPQPFPDSGRMEKLMNCPRCTKKRVPFWYAPYERFYETQCLGCGQTMVIRPEGQRLQDLGGVTASPSPFQDVTFNRDKALLSGDATQAFDHAHEKHDLGVREAHAKGLIPSMDEHD